MEDQLDKKIQVLEIAENILENEVKNPKLKTRIKSFIENIDIKGLTDFQRVIKNNKEKARVTDDHKSILKFVYSGHEKVISINERIDYFTEVPLRNHQWFYFNVSNKVFDFHEQVFIDKKDFHYGNKKKPINFDDAEKHNLVSIRSIKIINEKNEDLQIMEVSDHKECDLTQIIGLTRLTLNQTGQLGIEVMPKCHPRHLNPSALLFKIELVMNREYSIGKIVLLVNPSRGIHRKRTTYLETFSKIEDGIRRENLTMITPYDATIDNNKRYLETKLDQLNFGKTYPKIIKNTRGMKISDPEVIKELEKMEKTNINVEDRLKEQGIKITRLPNKNLLTEDQEEMEVFEQVLLTQSDSRDDTAEVVKIVNIENEEAINDDLTKLPGELSPKVTWTLPGMSMTDDANDRRKRERRLIEESAKDELLDAFYLNEKNEIVINAKKIKRFKLNVINV